jgi:hypothetical protein
MFGIPDLPTNWKIVVVKAFVGAGVAFFGALSVSAEVTTPMLVGAAIGAGLAFFKIISENAPEWPAARADGFGSWIQHI